MTNINRIYVLTEAGFFVVRFQFITAGRHCNHCHDNDLNQSDDPVNDFVGDNLMESMGAEH